jgi:hypothetical protein
MGLKDAKARVREGAGRHSAHEVLVVHDKHDSFGEPLGSGTHTCLRRVAKVAVGDSSNVFLTTTGVRGLFGLC